MAWSNLEAPVLGAASGRCACWATWATWLTGAPATGAAMAFSFGVACSSWFLRPARSAARAGRDGLLLGLGLRGGPFGLGRVDVLLQEIAQPVDGAGVQSARPALRLSDDRARLLERLVLEIVGDEQAPLVVGEPIDRESDALLELALLDALLGVGRLVLQLQVVHPLPARPHDPS